MDDQDFKRNPRTALLFDAADLLEKRAERCMDGPWLADGRDVVVERDPQHYEIAEHVVSHDEADWIAMMGPDIAPALARHLRAEGRELALNEWGSGDTPATREFTRDKYGDLLVLASKILKRDEVPWTKAESV